MSESGLYTHLYVQLRHCAELIDHVIVALSAGNTAGDRKLHQDLANILRAVQNAPSSNLDAVLLANILRESRVAAGADWMAIADGIDRGEISETGIEMLEALAKALETQRAYMHARVHGAYAR